MKRCYAVISLLVAILSTPAVALADERRVQFCWAMGKFDNTVYFAEAETLEDRQASFEQLLEISGLDPNPAQCRILESASHRAARAHHVKDWLDLELEVVNTTFLSDLDY